ncbi:universal stress protein [Sphingorhabdus sp.]|uniref:universal stress protein n=1 Tax=Sphingorhabdus sp. TaxID=1902408 RepID=UPI0035B150DD
MYHNILVPLDVNDPINAQHALESARFIADAAGATVHLLYVRLSLPTSYAQFLPTNYDAREKQEYMDQLAEWKTLLALPEDRVTVTLRRGPISSEIFDEARQRNVDLIIIGSHQPSLSSRYLGSNANAITRDAKISVLIVRADERETA